MDNRERFDLEYGLGDRVSDRITGYTGVVVAFVDHFGGSLRIGLSREEPTDDGEKPSAEWFDADRLQLEEANVVEYQQDKHVFEEAKERGIWKEDIAKDSVTNFEGVVASLNDWLYGCHFIGIKPQELDSDGDTINRKSFAIDRVELIEQRSDIHEEEEEDNTTTAPSYTGGPDLETDHDREGF